MTRVGFFNFLPHQIRVFLKPGDQVRWVEKGAGNVTATVNETRTSDVVVVLEGVIAPRYIHYSDLECAFVEDSKRVERLEAY